MINEVKGTQHTLVQQAGKNQAPETGDNHVNHGDREKHATSASAREVSLTDTAAKLQRVEAQIANQPVVDTQKVESVKKAIADGSFKVDSGRAAEKMAEFESLLASKSGEK